MKYKIFELREDQQSPLRFGAEARIIFDDNDLIWHYWKIGYNDAGVITCITPTSVQYRKPLYTDMKTELCRRYIIWLIDKKEMT